MARDVNTLTQLFLTGDWFQVVVERYECGPPEELPNLSNHCLGTTVPKDWHAGGQTCEYSVELRDSVRVVLQD